MEARAREQRIWAEHAGHHAKSRGLSPFVKRRWVPKTSWFTVHLVGTVQNPVVVRAYPGDEHPPLPWMASAADCGWERGALVEYWRTHAYPWRDTLARQGSQSPTPPSWYMP
ncbi:hypothetical protein IPM09_04420 [Candidatus Saccharibacteria bacterium]|nr:MAG: hypothetical protein IPM09_04420 [Candidatus Saccharibacteria bacterium]